MKNVIIKFDKYLAGKNLELDAIVIGGAALLVMDITSRVTRDVDLIAPQIPKDIKDASLDFCKENPDLNLDNDWLNNGPFSIIRDPPNNWKSRVIEIYNGKAILLKTLGRDDLLKTKLFAMCDRGTDLQDCISLNPTLEEIENSIEWIKNADASELWPKRVDEMINLLKQKLGLGNE